MIVLRDITREWRELLTSRGGDGVIEKLVTDLAVGDHETLEQLRRAADFFDRFELSAAGRADLRRAATRFSNTGSTPELESRNARAADQDRALAADLEAGSNMERADTAMNEVKRLECELAQLRAERDRLAACLATAGAPSAGDIRG